MNFNFNFTEEDLRKERFPFSDQISDVEFSSAKYVPENGPSSGYMVFSFIKKDDDGTMYGHDHRIFDPSKKIYRRDNETEREAIARSFDTFKKHIGQLANAYNISNVTLLEYFKNKDFSNFEECSKAIIELFEKEANGKAWMKIINRKGYRTLPTTGLSIASMDKNKICPLQYSEIELKNLKNMSGVEEESDELEFEDEESTDDTPTSQVSKQESETDLSNEHFDLNNLDEDELEELGVV